ncbi:MAG: Hpt domain-containing protein [Rhodospirillales bacterium]|nr:Hpt domain-containing protein [Rhodospirillales bacterium]
MPANASEELKGPGIASGSPQDNTGGDSQPPLLDEEQLRSIQQVIAPAEFHSLVESYLTNAASRLDRIDELAARGDLPGLRREAHDLISTAGNFGVRRVEALAHQLHAACKNDDGDAARRVVAEVRSVSVSAWALMRSRFLDTGAVVQ